MVVGMETESAAVEWEARYREKDQLWSGNPNQVLVDVVSTLAPGRVVDLGCGEGGDSLWLASQGWQVLGLDFSPTAIERARRATAAANLEADFEVVDLEQWQPDGPYDLVVASFFHSHRGLERTAVLRTAAGAVVPGGHLFILGHAEPPPWSRSHADKEGGSDEDGAPQGPQNLLGPEEEVSTLNLGEEWRVVISETRERSAVGPDGLPADLIDSVVLLQRGV